MADWTTTVPSARSTARAAARCRCTGYVALAMPHPMSQCAVAHRPGLGTPAPPSEPLRPDRVAFAERLARPRQPGVRVAIGMVAQPELERIDRERRGKLVHGGFEGEAAGPVAGRPHRRRMRRVDAGEAVGRRHRGTGVEHLRDAAVRIAELVDGRALRDGVVLERGQAAVGAGPDGDAVDRRRPAAHHAEHLVARQLEPHRPADEPRRHHRDHHARPPAPPLGPEAAAEEARDHADGIGEAGRTSARARRGRPARPAGTRRA